MAGNRRDVLQLMLLLQIWAAVLTLAKAVRSLDEEVLTLTTPASSRDYPNPPARRDVYSHGKIHDITHLINPRMPKWGSPDGMGKVVTIIDDMKKGAVAYTSEMDLPSHTGTHVDAPSHFFEEYFERGFDTSTLSLKTLNGPALVIDVPRNSNITAEVMKNLQISQGIHRVLFRTLNTDRKLMYTRKFHSDYVGIVKDGASWIVDNTNITLVGIDYLSIATYDDAVPTHQTLLKSRKIVIVEGLKLNKVPAGIYDLHCLPIKVLGAEGTPARCILMS
ncbi:cyclase-like protein 2 [Manihot esculenta]|uniref:Uncharacterized protein n=2 Tax=Manihot esculenta TaxID=3983 RepID=A0ACB7HF65_MANES|nr:cyclase-like protein 2 [Manihot esculenta]XP_043814497.1 cyclase-like protein 2 [Manihot esculenta]KAG8650796.1 hypothetical protein MANES_07G068020v8 [Manihot esculenta]OAY45522.1 hypothetical protein MANES_07G068000v8 [Manihot esculenta]